ncbi:MAG: methylmalonyl Co-A mutase-associated GTPase MeaB [Flavobacteriales bacterium]|nr:methylmalonyl Co-A mutase-associated GTPase MeaB [Flavobacteriales bacterium]
MSSQHDAARKAEENLKSFSQSLDVNELSAAVLRGEKKALAQAITLVESTRLDHADSAAGVIAQCLPHSGRSIRIGITGVPGVGKSTFIDVFGMHLIRLGKKVAVLAIDPTSQISKGSILGDKTRMNELAAHEQAFIRPSPSSETLGGVARKTRETIILCEAAGYDVILVETVGVGQSETAVHQMTDFFLLLMLAGAGDQLQGIKRGIMEMCDAMVITKADGDNIKAARFAKAEYTGALHLFPPKESGWIPQVEMTSATERRGLSEVWQMICDFERWMKDRDLFEAHRREQDIHWFHETIREKIIYSFYHDPSNISRIAAAESDIRAGKVTPFKAASNI